MKDFIINDKRTLAEFLYTIEQEWSQHHYLEVTIKRQAKQRTMTQNAALHLFLTRLAQVLNDAGYDMKKTLKPEADIPWTPISCKEFLWRPIQEALTGKASTTEITTIEPTVIHETLCRHLGSKLGITCPEWPSRELAVGAWRPVLRLRPKEAQHR